MFQKKNNEYVHQMIDFISKRRRIEMAKVIKIKE